MDTHNPYFARAEIDYRREQARQEFRRRRRKSTERYPNRPIGKPLADDGL